ncbi:MULTISPECIES: DinB family protein [Aequorivita]|uniref:DinB family protein n=2 Tax=Aequorivita TaxID=153265 RepID=A0AB35YNT6_9FLAO|nr:DinB family protein [Aequorivita sp. Ant34-E75]WGF92071.1 DinB family protein [Aequorivita sp. Ant34-E75]
MTLTDLDKSTYNSYYQKYLNLVGDKPLLEALQRGQVETENYFENLETSLWEYRYKENKWTPKDILQHIIDTERVFVYRALYFSRVDEANLDGFDENLFAENALANLKTADALLKEYSAVRNATISLYSGFSTMQLRRCGKANNSVLSVAAAGFIICGHEIHHRNIINERYL